MSEVVDSLVVEEVGDEVAVVHCRPSADGGRTGAGGSGARERAGRRG